MILRSFLFAPANHARHVAKALSGAADGTILDLEDAVAVSEKPAARVAAHDILAQRTATVPAAYVRINALSTPFAFADLHAVVGPGLAGIIVPKTESAEHMAIVDWLLHQLELERGLTPGSIDLMPIIETAVGLTHMAEIATASPRVRRLNFGAGDFSLDTNMTWTAGHPGLLWARIQTVIASRAAGLEPPIDTVFADLANSDGLRAETMLAQQLGFQGKACIHPDQVTIVNDVFTPTPAEVERAQRIVTAFADAERAGVASFSIDGQFVDYPVAAKAQRILTLATHSKRGN